ncbi:hypothetical protein N9J96_00675 [Paracoccaceae bacterium]|nr:hypothetical protein [Paracoccaceae bacterium]
MVKDNIFNLMMLKPNVNHVSALSRTEQCGSSCQAIIIIVRSNIKISKQPKQLELPY